LFASAAGAAAGTVDNVKADTREAVAMTKQVAADSWITTKVKSEILADSASKGFEVNVTTTDGVVVLTGVLGNPEAIVRVREIAAKVDGVKAVDTTALRVQAGK
jgi:hyperosmotically inducible protein